MAYNSSMERTEVGKVQKNQKGDYLVVSSYAEKDGGHTIDMRLFYTEKETEELKPTQKGVRFNSEQSMEVMMLLVKALDETTRADFLSQLQADYNFD